MTLTLIKQLMLPSGVCKFTDRAMINCEPPPNFSWLEEGVLAACALPQSAAHYRYIRFKGILHIVNLTGWTCNIGPIPTGLKFINIPVQEFGPPTVEQMLQFTSLVEEAKNKQEAVIVHCFWGMGRTGTMLAAYLVKTQGMSPYEAIHAVRQRRPGSIETTSQEQAVHKYAARINQMTNSQ